MRRERFKKVHVFLITCALCFHLFNVQLCEHWIEVTLAG
jgi:hypothetical protein